MFIIGVITAIVNCICIELDHSDLQYTEKYKNLPNNIQLCNLGSSHGLYGFNYEEVDDKVCFNFALLSQSLSYDCRILECFRDNLAENSTVYIVVSYFSVFGKDETEGERFAPRNKKYYDFLPKEYIKNYSAKEKLYEVYFPSLTKGSDIFNVLLGKSVNKNDELWKREASDIDIYKDANEAYIRHFVTDKLDDQGNLIYNQEEIDALYSIIQICKEENARPVLVTTPFLSEYLDAISDNNPQVFDTFYTFIQEVVESTSVEYYDYSHDERFVHRYDWFMNSDHLNKEGARQFTRIILSDTQ